MREEVAKMRPRWFLLKLQQGRKSELKAWKVGFKNYPVVPVGLAHLFFFFLKYTRDRWDNSAVQRAPNGVEGQRLHMFSPSWSYLFYTSRIQTILQREIAGLALSKPTHLSWRPEKCLSWRKAWEALKSQLLHSAWRRIDARVPDLCRRYSFSLLP